MAQTPVTISVNVEGECSGLDIFVYPKQHPPPPPGMGLHLQAKRAAISTVSCLSNPVAISFPLS